MLDSGGGKGCGKSRTSWSSRAVTAGSGVDDGKSRPPWLTKRSMSEDTDDGSELGNAGLTCLVTGLTAGGAVAGAWAAHGAASTEQRSKVTARIDGQAAFFSITNLTASTGSFV